MNTLFPYTTLFRSLHQRQRPQQPPAIAHVRHRKIVRGVARIAQDYSRGFPTRGLREISGPARGFTRSIVFSSTTLSWREENRNPCYFNRLRDSRFRQVLRILQGRAFPLDSRRTLTIWRLNHLRIRSALHRGANPMKRAVLYTRVSTFDQNPETQALDLRRLAEQRGFEIVHEYTDRISGVKAKRPALDQMLTAAHRREFDTVLVWAL